MYARVSLCIMRVSPTSGRLCLEQGQLERITDQTALVLNIAA
jgi:hypothetical protein